MTLKNSYKKKSNNTKKIYQNYLNYIIFFVSLKSKEIFMWSFLINLFSITNILNSNHIIIQKL